MKEEILKRFDEKFSKQILNDYNFNLGRNPLKEHRKFVEDLCDEYDKKLTK